MSQSEELQQTASIFSKSEFEDVESALEALVQLKDLEFDDIFTNRDTQLDTDAGSGISIVFFHDEVMNYLDMNTDEDDNLTIRLSLSDGSIESAGSILTNIMEVVGNVKVQSITLRKDYKQAFRSLELPVDWEADTNIVGIRLEKNGDDYIIQEGEREMAGTHVTMSREGIDTQLKALETDFLIEELSRVDQFIQEEL